MRKILAAFFIFCASPAFAGDDVEPVAIISTSKDVIGGYFANELTSLFMKSKLMKLSHENDAVLVVRVETIDPNAATAYPGKEQVSTAISVVITSKILTAHEKYESSFIGVCGASVLAKCADGTYVKIALALVGATRNAKAEFDKMRK